MTHISFETILKYYSRPKPLGLSPSSLPTLWTLSPPSLIHRGRSAPGGVYILLNILHTYKYNNRLLAFKHLGFLA